MTQASRRQKKELLLDFMVQGEISEADTPTIRRGATPTGLVSDPPPSSPIFKLDALPLNCSWLGTGSKYTGLHTQWLG